ncbi:MAG: HAD family phosphatase [bacterium]
MIKLIIFDLGNIILNFDHNIICRKLSQISRFSPQQVYEIIFTSGLERLYDEGKISTRDFFKKVSNRLKLNISLTGFKQIWQDIFWLNEGIEEILLSLRGRYKLFLLSNTNEIHFELAMAKFDVLNLIDEYILSYQVGFSKPAKEIFYEALKRANVEAEKCIYIDDIKEHIASASKIGMNVILFQSISQLKMDLWSALSG